MLLCALVLQGCGESDFTAGKWTANATGMPDFNCRGNLDVLIVGGDRIQRGILGQARGDWADLKTQFKEDGKVVVKGRAGEVFRFRDDGDGSMTLEEAPAAVSSSWRVPSDLVRCADAGQAG